MCTILFILSFELHKTATNGANLHLRYYIRCLDHEFFEQIMKKCFLRCLVAAMTLLTFPALSQTDEALLNLRGDNLDLYAVLDLFQKSKTIEEFEKTLNLEKTGINNLELDLDQKVDFIKENFS